MQGARMRGVRESTCKGAWMGQGTKETKPCVPLLSGHSLILDPAAINIIVVMRHVRGT